MWTDAVSKVPVFRKLGAQCGQTPCLHRKCERIPYSRDHRWVFSASRHLEKASDPFKMWSDSVPARQDVDGYHCH